MRTPRKKLPRSRVTSRPPPSMERRRSRISITTSHPPPFTRRKRSRNFTATRSHTTMATSIGLKWWSCIRRRRSTTIGNPRLLFTTSLGRLPTTSPSPQLFTSPSP
ncbi:hypothetical protein KP509_25G009300 [Ceratopteris richardii]|uniref:Uncharacterized protein n=1 Tax=Ceratopteris richardii TaxID=49495 RepID=A0A8T2RNZ2_CERRI|nr:hypothetical protein KP509_25G009300 [Ceratopteris richardii]